MRTLLLFTLVTFILGYVQLSQARVSRTNDTPYRETLKELALGAEAFLHSHKTSDGITHDPRALTQQTEEVRLNVVPQELGYLELYHYTGRASDLQEAIDRADFLIAHFDLGIRHAAYDGMLAYALFAAYQATGTETYRTHADTIIKEMMTMPPEHLRLNTGLMAGMGLAKSFELTQRKEQLEKLTEVLRSLEQDQNADGSFPHAYDGTDTHYSSWIAMELILIEKSLGQTVVPEIQQILTKLRPFLKARITLSEGMPAKYGEPSYEAKTCDLEGNCETRYYYAQATASEPEYDTRGWSNELGYEALDFDYFGDEEHAAAVTAFLQSLSNGGAFPDKWAYPIDPSYDQYPWSIAPQSVVRTSLLMWELAYTLNLGH